MKPTSHRNLFNADCNTYCYEYAEGSNPWQHVGSQHGELSPLAIQAYIDLLVNSGVDTLVYNPASQRAWWPSKTTPTPWDGYTRGDVSFFNGNLLNEFMTPTQVEAHLRSLCRLLDRYLDLQEAGVDLLAETSRACRRAGITPWLSVRMNDMHGAFEGPFMDAPLLADDEFRLAGCDVTGVARPNLRALNYEKREVRDYMFTMIRELVDDYDFEGLELDWTRHLGCCNPVATQQATETITAWHGEIARLCAAKANASGRPFYFGVRTAANMAHQRTLGLDILAMAREGMLDFVCPTRAGWSTTWDLDYGRMRQQFGEDMALYGVVEGAPNWLPAYAPAFQYRHYLRYQAASAAMLHGNAAGKLASGADGIELFNFFCVDQHAGFESVPRGLNLQAHYPAIKGIDNLDAMRGKLKFYAFSAGYELGGVRTILEVDEYLPQYFEPTTQRRFRLPMCAESAGMELTIQLIVERPADDANFPKLGVSFNDAWPNWHPCRTDELLAPTGDLTHHIPGHTALNFHFSASDIREGWNELVVACGGDDPGEQARRKQAIKVVGIELLVSKASGAAQRG